MSKLIGNCKHLIDWEKVVIKLANTESGYVGPRHSASDAIVGIDDITSKWNKAQYVLARDGGSVGWDMFFPETHFDKSVVDIFCNYVGIQSVSAWISRINPGMMAPLHWDINDRENEYATQKPMLRFSCHICKPHPGHCFIVDNTTLYNQEQGTVYQWQSRKSWHGGVNFGYMPKYLFNIFGHAI